MSKLRTPLHDEAYRAQSATDTEQRVPLLCALVASLGWIVIGFEQGSTTTTLPGLKRSFSMKGDMIDAQLQAAVWVGVVLAALAATKMGDYFGRNLTIQAGLVLHVVGFAVGSVGAGLWDAIIGKAIFGLGVGLVLHSVPIYIAEISPLQSRGALVALPPVFLVLGVTGGSLIGMIPGQHTWRTGNFIGIGVTLVALAVTFWLPKSPQWIALRHPRDPGAAQRALARIRGVSETATIDEFNDIIQIISHPEHAAQPSAGRVLRGAGLVCLQAASGHVIASHYLHDLVVNALTERETAHIAVALTLATASLVGAAMVALLLVDKVGRKKLLLTGLVGMVAGCIGLAVAFHKYGTDSSIVTIVLLVSLLSFFQIGFGAVMWLMLCEMFPLPWRSATISWLIVLNAAVTGAMLGLTDVMRHNIGAIGTFGGHAAVCAVACLFVKFFLRDDTGKPLAGQDQLG